MNASVVVCAYTLDRWDSMVAAIESCVDQTCRPQEIILVIDHNDELLARASILIPDARVIPNRFAKGLSGARNTGVEASGGEVVVFLDDDAYAEKEWLEALMEPFNDERVAGVGGWITPHWESSSPAWFPETFLWTLGCSYAGLPRSESVIRNPIGANMAIRRSVFSRVGGFTAGLGRIGRIPLGGEETELCIRFNAVEPSMRFVLCRDAIVHHRVPASRLTWHYFWTRCWAEGLSKAAVSSLSGTESGLSSERRHLVSALPLEFAHSLIAALRNPKDGLRRASLIAAGTALAAVGLMWGQLSLRRHPLSAVTSANEWKPVNIISVDLDPRSTPVEVMPSGRAWVQAMVGGHVVSVFETTIGDSGVLPASDLVRASGEFVNSSLASLDVADEELPFASVVVATICRDPSQLLRTVSSILELDYPRFEIIVVDNRTEQVRAPLPIFPESNRVLRVVEERTPGASAARNRGVALASGEFVAFTDDDAVVDSTWLRALGARFTHNPEVEGIGGLVLPLEFESPAQLWFEEFYGGFTRSFRPQLLSINDHDGAGALFPYGPGAFGAGCNMAFRRATLERLGGFNVALGPGTPSRGGEDPAVFIELAASGGVVAVEPSAVVRHAHRRSEQEFMSQVFGYGTGLTAMYTSLVVKNPTHALALLSRVPAGLSLLTRPREDRSASSSPSYPARTYAHQLLGMAYGPLAYARSVAHVRQRARHSSFN